MGSLTSTIDIELQAPTDQLMRGAEDLANAIVFEDRPMNVHLVNEEEAARLPLRKESAIKGTIRVIEIENFDWSPCGGTHAARTGQIGLIAVRSFERAKKMTRVEFVCGGRALAEYRRTNATAFAVAKQFSAERDTSPELVAGALQETKVLRKRIRDLLELAMSAEASRELSLATSTRGVKIIHAVFDKREPDEIKVLASKIAEAEPAVALLATKLPDGARLVFARSASVTADMGKLMTEACEILGGRGGGRPDLAQGGGQYAERAEEAIAMTANRVASLV